ncbi:MAG: hypothetical protein IPK16_16335 [Anaerolineales bacterium]|nr:hypothetical protein [Anaerolineales bacterium]
MSALAHYFDSTNSAAERAAATMGVVTRDILVVGQRIRLQYVGEALFSALWPALSHLEIAGPHTGIDLSFYLWDGSAGNVFPAAPPILPEQYHRFGQRAIIDTPEYALLHAPLTGELSVYNRSARTGLYFVESAAHLSIYDKAAPLQTLLLWALRELGWHFVHAAAVGSGERGVLLVGGAGSGKSTTALTCLQEPGLRFLSDDKCLVRLNGALEAFGIYSSAKIKRDMVAWLPEHGGQVIEWHGNAGQEKGLTYLFPRKRECLATQFQVEALLLPTITHQRDATTHRTQANAVFRTLGPSTVMWLPGSEADTYRFMATMAQQVPCYRLGLATDLRRNANAIRHFLEEGTG